MNIAVAQTRSAGRVDRGTIKIMVSFFLNKAAARTGIRWGDISVLLTGDPECRDINRQHLGHDYETDVISFNLDPLPGDPESLSHGEIVVNVTRARRMGPKFGGADRELALYLAHGCDHLSGGEDSRPAERLQMRRRELRWLRAAKAAGLSFRLTAPGQSQPSGGHRKP